MTALTTSKPATEPVTGTTNRRRREVKQNLTIAAAATGVSITTRLIYPPLEIAALPLMLALGVRPAQRAYSAWRHERRLSVEVAETLALSLFVLPGNFVIGSLAFAAYHLGQAIVLTLDAQNDADSHPQPLIWVRRLTDEREVTRPLTAICSGDTIVVETGEMIPLPGVVTEGTAWVRNFKHDSEAHTTDNSPERTTTVTRGHRVKAAAIVQVGRLHICVEDA